MKIDLALIPTTFDTIHAALAATVVGLFFLLILILIVTVVAFSRKKMPAAPTVPQPATPTFEPVVQVRTETVVVKEATPEAALQLLGLLQKEARFLDFLQEDVTAYSDAEIGAAARVVHQGCSKVVRQYFELSPVRSEAEGSRITLPKGFDAASVRLTGNIVGEAPFHGTVIHRGFRASSVKLPKITEGHDVSIVAQAEVEL